MKQQEETKPAAKTVEKEETYNRNSEIKVTPVEKKKFEEKKVEVKKEEVEKEVEEEVEEEAEEEQIYDDTGEIYDDTSMNHKEEDAIYDDAAVSREAEAANNEKEEEVQGRGRIAVALYDYQAGECCESVWCAS